MLSPSLIILTFHLLSAGIDAGLVQQSYNGSMYVAEKAAASYQEAFNWCTGMGGHLPSIHTPADADFIMDKLQMGSVWLGGGEISDTFYWTDGSPWNPLPELWMKSSCYTCCGLILSITKKITAKNKCDYFSSRYNKVCRVPNAMMEYPSLKEQVTEQENKIAQRLTVEDIVYRELVNATRNHDGQLGLMQGIIDTLILEVNDMKQELDEMRGMHNETNSTVHHHVSTLNESLYQQMQQIHESLNLSSQIYNFSIVQQHDMYASILRRMHDQMSSQSLKVVDDWEDKFSGLNHDVKRLTIVLTSVLILSLAAVGLMIWLKFRKRGEISDDEVRLSQINETY